MRICHIITRMVAGGAQRNTLMCAENQAQQGHEVSLISGVETSSEGSLLEEARQAALDFIELPSLVRELSPLQDLMAFWNLVWHLRRLRPHVVHTHTSKAGILGRLAAAMCGVPVVVHTPHGHVFHSYFSDRKARLFKICERLLGSVTDCVVGLSSGCVRDHLEEKIVPAYKLVTIPSGVPLERFREIQVIPAASPRLGYLGRLADIKGALDLVDAFALLKTDFPDLKLTLVGDGPQRPEVEAKIAHLGLGESVVITGWQTDPVPYLRSMDLLVVPSHNEGMGRVVVEALAAGVPVVATRVGGLVDLVIPGFTGQLASARDPAGLARAVRCVLELPDQGRSLGSNGRVFSENFSDKVMFERLELLYERLVRQAGLRLQP